MERPYQTNPTDSKVNFFVGKEVEHTPMYNKDTLFVVGIQDLTTIESIAFNNDISHIYLGANMSFHPSPALHKLATSLLEKDYWVTLDYPVAAHSWIDNCEFNKFDKFIGMISVPIQNILNSNKNATIKLDDIRFDHSNPGVWTISLDSLLNGDEFTSWDKYKKDTVILPDPVDNQKDIQ